MKQRPNGSDNNKPLIAIILFVIISVSGLMFGVSTIHARTLSHTAVRARNPLSRQVVAYQQSLVKELRPAPTLAALQYAYVASAYSDALSKAGQPVGLIAAMSVMRVMYPLKTSVIQQETMLLAQQNHISMTLGQAIAKDVADKYVQRYEHDGHDLVWDGKVPKGPGKWLKITLADPFTPRAGEWQRWNVNQTIAVPAPPTYGGAEDKQQLAIVQDAVATRNGQDINLINFWGGTPGSETPAGIWQNELYKTTTADLPGTILAADTQYALVQKDLAQTLSDAFMECWKVKYTYWTARPSMRIPGLATAMNDPNFPGYISGHSTISKAAADVLSALAPSHQSAWQAMASEARQSRLKAGIHFDVDNAVGFQVGDEVGRQTISRLQLKTIIN